MYIYNVIGPCESGGGSVYIHVEICGGTCTFNVYYVRWLWVVELVVACAVLGVPIASHVTMYVRHPVTCQS